MGVMIDCKGCGQRHDNMLVRCPAKESGSAVRKAAPVEAGGGSGQLGTAEHPDISPPSSSGRTSRFGRGSRGSNPRGGTKAKVDVNALMAQLAEIRAQKAKDREATRERVRRHRAKKRGE